MYLSVCELQYDIYFSLCISVSVCELQYDMYLCVCLYGFGVVNVLCIQRHSVCVSVCELQYDVYI